MSADLTIKHAHRTALRRIERGEPVGDLGELLGALYLHGLVDDLLGEGHAPEIRLTALGRKVLEAHDAQAATRELPRPTPTLPDGWREEGNALAHRDVESPVVVALLRCDTDVALTRAIRQTEAMLALMRWEQGRRTLARLVELREQRAEAVAS